ncbi:CoA-transferase family III [Multifurca ochricompacta]|uniref:CoA-transferase family III n=1 Tax=Multifurca ochricompacta TaxID=376703 RepID=A0AAD4M1S4_9AGAM|nr:CoA-transferase family III [Multifurca ochricompacta]
MFITTIIISFDQLIDGPAKTVWVRQGLPPDDIQNLRLTEAPDPSVNSSFKLGTAAQSAIGLSALAAAHFHFLQTGREEEVHVDARHAILEFNSEKYYTIDGKVPEGQLFDELSDIYKTKDGYVRLHTNFAHHKKGLLDILQCEPTKSAVAVALADWSAEEFEAEVFRRHLCAAALRSFEAMDMTPHGIFQVNINPVSITKIGDAPKRVLTDSGNVQFALEGIRVLDLTRVLAGPVCGRTLAAHGADVLLVTSPHLPSFPLLDMETSRGKRTTQLDLDVFREAETLRELVRDADVFLQAYRPGGLAGRGFGPEDCAAIRPGIVHASLTAFSPGGPLEDVKSFDSLAEAYADYIRATQGEEEATKLPPYRALPMQALDHAAGYLLAFGIAAALCKTVTEGGSWRVRVSLSATLLWIRRFGNIDPINAFGEGRPLPPRGVSLDPEVAAVSTTVEEDPGDDFVEKEGRERQEQGQGQGRGQGKGQGHRRTMTAIRHAATFTHLRIREGKAPMRLDAHKPEWLPRP